MGSIGDRCGSVGNDACPFAVRESCGGSATRGITGSGGSLRSIGINQFWFGLKLLTRVQIHVLNHLVYGCENCISVWSQVLDIAHT